MLTTAFPMKFVSLGPKEFSPISKINSYKLFKEANILNDWAPYNPI